jgi:TonB family protein
MTSRNYYYIAFLYALILHCFLITAYFFYERHYRNNTFSFAGKTIQAYVLLPKFASENHQLHSNKTIATQKKIVFPLKKITNFSQYQKEPTSPKTSVLKIQKQASQKMTKQYEGHVNSPSSPAFIQLLHNAIQQKQHYPEKALNAEQEGTATVQFFLFPDGHIKALQLIQSSGSTSLDQAALEAVHNAAPFQKVSIYLKQGGEFQIEVTFSLDSSAEED